MLTFLLKVFTLKILFISIFSKAASTETLWVALSWLCSLLPQCTLLNVFSVNRMISETIVIA